LVLTIYYNTQTEKIQEISSFFRQAAWDFLRGILFPRYEGMHKNMHKLHRKAGAKAAEDASFFGNFMQFRHFDQTHDFPQKKKRKKAFLWKTLLRVWKTCAGKGNFCLDSDFACGKLLSSPF